MRSYIEIGKQVLEIESQGLISVKESLDEHFFLATQCLVNCKGNVVFTGMGKSGLIARKVSAMFSSVGYPSFFLHPVESLHGDLGMLREQDVIVAFSNSGETEELLLVMPEFVKRGCKSIAITGNLHSTLARMADFPVQVKVPVEACRLKLVPTASTTAALAVGDAFAACLIEASNFSENDFYRCHPGGAIGMRLSLKITAIMSSDDLPFVRRDVSLRESLVVLDKGNYGIVFVVNDQNYLEGVVTDGDIRRGVARGRLDLDSPVATFMTTCPVTIDVGVTVGKALDVAEKHSISVLPVLEGSGRLCGIVHLHDLLGKGRIPFSSNGQCPSSPNALA